MLVGGVPWENPLHFTNAVVVASRDQAPSFICLRTYPQAEMCASQFATATTIVSIQTNALLKHFWSAFIFHQRKTRTFATISP